MTNGTLCIATSLAFITAVSGPSPGCAASSRVAPEAPVTRRVVTAGDPFELPVRTSVVVGTTGVTVTFEKVASDSRCPVGVTCVWEGDAEVVLTIARAGQANQTVTLHTSPGAQREAKVEGVLVRLVALAPQPVADTPVDPGTYRASLIVTASP